MTDHSATRPLPTTDEAPPTLLVTSDGVQHGRRLEITGADHLIGRDPACDLRLDDPYASRRHARLGRSGTAAVIEDLGSRAGSFVNGVEISGPVVLHDGDAVTLGATDLRFLAPSEPPPVAPPVRAQPPVPAPTPRHGAATPTPPATRFDVDQQHAGTINNVGRDQYNQRYYQLRIAPMRQRARLLLRLGVAALLSATGIYFVMFLAFSRQIIDWIESVFGATGGGPPPSMPDISFEALLLLPVVLLLGFAGVVMIVTSLLMRRQANRREEHLREEFR